MEDSTAQRVRFDLPSGSVRAGAEERVVLVPCSALDELGKSAGSEVARGFARALGASMGAKVLSHIGSKDAVRTASLETFVNELGVQLAIAGWGAVALERWGRAMVLVVEHSPVADSSVVAAILEGALATSTGRDVRCVSLDAREGSTARVLVANERAVARVRGWLADGAPWGDVLTRLQTDGSHA